MQNNDMDLGSSKLNDRFWVVAKAFHDLLIWAGMAGVIKPAAKVLSRNMLMRVADGLGVIVSLFPFGIKTYWTVRSAYGLTRLGAMRMSAQCHARIFRDNVVMRRMIEGVEDIDGYKLREVNPEKVTALAETGESFIVVTGHFTREALLILYTRCAQMGQVIALVNERPKLSGSLFERLHQHKLITQYGSMIDCLECIAPGKIEQVLAGANKQPMKPLMRKMKKAGNLAFFAIDAPWHGDTKGAISRPFASESKQVFALGATRLARSTGCPLVICFPWLDEDGTVVIEWGDPISISRQDEKGEQKVMNEFLDQIEVNIGRRPNQYVLPIGFGRHWDKHTKSWVDNNS
jgi:hypothetical protein